MRAATAKAAATVVEVKAVVEVEAVAEATANWEVTAACGCRGDRSMWALVAILKARRHNKIEPAHEL